MSAECNSGVWLSLRATTVADRYFCWRRALWALFWSWSREKKNFIFFSNKTFKLKEEREKKMITIFFLRVWKCLWDLEARSRPNWTGRLSFDLWCWRRVAMWSANWDWCLLQWSTALDSRLEWHRNRIVRAQSTFALDCLWQAHLCADRHLMNRKKK